MSDPVRLAIVLPGLHRVNRGAETAFESIGREIAQQSGWRVTLFGSGVAKPNDPYEFVHVPCTPRERFERWPRFPPFRSPEVWEEWTFVRNLRKRYDPRAFDAVLTCSYPFCNWFFQRTRRGHRPIQVFVTQNGDWPCFRKNSEYRWFNCDHLICINPDYYDNQKQRYPSELISNGVDIAQFSPGKQSTKSFWGLNENFKTILIVAALVPSKRVMEGVEIVSQLENVNLLVAGNGPLRESVDCRGKELLGSRFKRVEVPRQQMPEIYKASDVMLHMSMDEPFGNVYTESLAMGLPIVTHDRSLTRWILESTSYLVDTTNQKNVIAALLRALSESSEDRKQERVNLARRRFTWFYVAQKYCEAIQDAIAGKTGSSTQWSLR